MSGGDPAPELDPSDSQFQSKLGLVLVRRWAEREGVEGSLSLDHSVVIDADRPSTVEVDGWVADPPCLVEATTVWDLASGRWRKVTNDLLKLHLARLAVQGGGCVVAHTVLISPSADVVAQLTQGTRWAAAAADRLGVEVVHVPITDGERAAWAEARDRQAGAQGKR